MEQVGASVARKGLSLSFGFAFPGVLLTLPPGLFPYFTQSFQCNSQAKENKRKLQANGNKTDIGVTIILFT